MGTRATHLEPEWQRTTASAHGHCLSVIHFEKPQTNILLLPHAHCYCYGLLLLPAATAYCYRLLLLPVYPPITMRANFLSHRPSEKWEMGGDHHANYPTIARGPQKVGLEEELDIAYHCLLAHCHCLWCPWK